MQKQKHNLAIWGMVKIGEEGIFTLINLHGKGKQFNYLKNIRQKKNNS